MTEDLLATLLERNRAHVAGLAPGYFDPVRETQRPPVVSMCCSDSRVSQEGMWNVSEPGWLFTPSTIGNQVWDDYDGERVVSGNLLYPVTHTETRTVVVVGHTGCGAITTALGVARGEVDLLAKSPGVRKWISMLVPVVEEALETGVVDSAGSTAATIDRLVEYNVDRQVAFLQENDEVPADEDVFGFVYDFMGAYGGEPGLAYLINVNGETDPEAIRARIPTEYAPHVHRLLDT